MARSDDEQGGFVVGQSYVAPFQERPGVVDGPAVQAIDTLSLGVGMLIVFRRKRWL